MSNFNISTAYLFVLSFTVFYFSGLYGGSVPHLALIKAEWNMLTARYVISIGNLGLIIV